MEIKNKNFFLLMMKTRLLPFWCLLSLTAYYRLSLLKQNASKLVLIALLLSVLSCSDSDSVHAISLAQLKELRVKSSTEVQDALYHKQFFVPNQASSTKNTSLDSFEFFNALNLKIGYFQAENNKKNRIMLENMEESFYRRVLNELASEDYKLVTTVTENNVLSKTYLDLYSSNIIEVISTQTDLFSKKSFPNRVNSYALIISDKSDHSYRKQPHNHESLPEEATSFALARGVDGNKSIHKAHRQVHEFSR